MAKPTYNGPGFCSLLTILFIGLKLAGIIGWSWWWVLAPLWMPFTFVVSIYVICGIVEAINKEKSK